MYIYFEVVLTNILNKFVLKVKTLGSDLTIRVESTNYIV